MSRRTAPAQPCRHCGQPVYLPQLRRHEYHCQRITELLGSPQEMVNQFREVQDLLVVDFVERYPHVGLDFIKLRLLWGGLDKKELCGRVGKVHAPCGYKGGYYVQTPNRRRRFCKRCEIRLTHPGVPPGEEGYCGWCKPLNRPTAPAQRLPERERELVRS